MKSIILLSTIHFLGSNFNTSYVYASELSALPLINQDNLTYEGAFKMPTGTWGGSRFGYGGTALAYNPANNSLFMVGHDWDQMVAEASIPDPVLASNVSELPTSTVLQPFTDVTEGMMSSVGNGNIKVGGLLPFNNKLFGAVYVYYDADGSQKLSHFSSSFALSQIGDAQGMYQVGDGMNVKAGYVSGYMTQIPQEWQSSLGGPAITGNCCIPIVSRTSSGPAALIFNPEDLGKVSPAPTIPLVYYPYEHPLGPWGESISPSNPYFNGTTQIKGVVFPKGTRSLLFLGGSGLGEWCYGTGGITGECYDPIYGSKGNHAYPYANQVFAYDVLELLQVKNGTKKPWEVKPYQTWQFILPFQTEGDLVVKGAAYDPNTQRMFISHKNADNPLVIHVFKVTIPPDLEQDTIPPTPPQNLNLTIIPNG
ncbi:MAG: hypothetical protein R2806_00255 [Saprospiraceae bacterium]